MSAEGTRYPQARCTNARVNLIALTKVEMEVVLTMFRGVVC